MDESRRHGEAGRWCTVEEQEAKGAQQKVYRNPRSPPNPNTIRDRKGPVADNHSKANSAELQSQATCR